MLFKQEAKRSFTDFTISKVWNKKYTPFDIILNYCKMNRISLSIDEVNKTINFTPVSILFTDYSIIDYTNKVDKSKDFIIKPITWQDKYILFNSDDNKSKLGEDYKTKYGVNYGDLKITTDYNFNANENKLYKGINTPVVSSIPTISWEDVLLDKSIAIYDYGEPYVTSWDKDNKEISVFGSMLFFDGLQQFHLRYSQEGIVVWTPYISDDTDLQLKSQTYTYVHSKHGSKGGSYRGVSRYPRLTNKIKSGPEDNPYIAYNMFNIPMEEYVAEPQSNLPKYSIYKFVWENYINERYNKNNKAITCYLDLKPSDVLNFKFSNFIKINNQVYMVNKIYDYNVTSIDSTKVDLISVTDPNAYSKTIWGDIGKDIKNSYTS